MKRFRFDLEAVLTLRERRRDEAARTLAAICRERAARAAERDRFAEGLERLRGSVRDRRLAGTAAWEEGAFREAIVFEEEKIERCERELREIDGRERSAREELIRARMDFKKLEHLKERRRRRYLEEWRRKEERECQEIADAAFARIAVAESSAGKGTPYER